MTVYILEIGKFWDSEETSRIFISLEAAMANVPKGFKEKKSSGLLYYAENKRRHEWLGKTFIRCSRIAYKRRKHIVP